MTPSIMPMDPSLSAWLAPLVSEVYADRKLLEQTMYRNAVLEAIDGLTAGTLRVASREADGWKVHGWVKEAILLYFALRPLERMEAGVLTFNDKVPVQRPPHGVRVVPPGVVRHGAYVAPSSVIMPGYVNIGAYVDAGTMVDTWATVGSCAQIGRNVHLSGGVGIGGVLEPPGATPVIVEDGAFIGSRAVLVEGVLVEQEAVIGAAVVLTASTPIIDVRGPEPVELRGRVPARSVVIPGMRNKKFPAGEYGVPCALIVGTRNEKTDQKTSLEQALRDHGVAS